MGRIVFLTDRSPSEALPAVHSFGLDIKTDRLSPDSLPHLPELGPSVLLVDAEMEPDMAFGILASLRRSTTAAPVIVLLARHDLDRHPWDRVVDDLVFSGASSSELRLRFEILTRRTGGAGDAVVRLGPLSMNTETYRVMVSGRVLDLTYKEFELLSFLVQRPGRVFTRGSLLRQVWGYDFYGGTRTVDVHVRRLRAKLGVEHESLIETVRGVGYRAAEDAASDARTP